MTDAPVSFDLAKALADIGSPTLTPEQTALLKHMAEVGQLPLEGGLSFSGRGRESATLEGTERDAAATLGDYAVVQQPLPWAGVQQLLSAIIVRTLAKAAQAHSDGATNGVGSIATVPVATFLEESQYIVDAFDALDAPPFTLQRLCELLLEPCAISLLRRPRHGSSLEHGAPEDGFAASGGGAAQGSVAPLVLRGDVLQAAIRRCVLVSSVE